MKLNSDYISVDFSQQNLAGVELSGKFIDVDMTNTNLVGAILNGTFVDVDFTNADLQLSDSRDGRFIDCIGLK